jgi:hypothetical protein
VTTWPRSQDTIVELLNRGHLEHITGEAANGEYPVLQAHRRLAGARAAQSADRVGAFALAYEAVRQAATAALVQQGLRPRVEGGHVAVEEAVRAQFGKPFDTFNAMRKVRNQLEYPRNSSDVDLSAEDAEWALKVR